MTCSPWCAAAARGMLYPCRPLPLREPARMTSHHAFTQASLPGLEDPLLAASESLASQGSVDERGAIFTRSEVVEFILDLCGYTPDQPLHRFRLLEPSSGAG